MTEEEAPFGVVRIGVRFRPLVVRPVVATPLEDVILTGENVTEGEEEPQTGGCLITSVRPEPVGAGYLIRKIHTFSQHQHTKPNQPKLTLNANQREDDQQHQVEVRPGGYRGQQAAAVQCRAVESAHEDYIRPDDLRLIRRRRSGEGVQIG